MAGYPYTQVASDSTQSGYTRGKFLQTVQPGQNPTAGAAAANPPYLAGTYAFVLDATATRLAAAGQFVAEAWSVPNISKIDDL